MHYNLGSLPQGLWSQQHPLGEGGEPPSYFSLTNFANFAGKISEEKKSLLLFTARYNPRFTSECGFIHDRTRNRLHRSKAESLAFSPCFVFSLSPNCSRSSSASNSASWVKWKRNIFKPNLRYQDEPEEVGSHKEELHLKSTLSPKPFTWPRPLRLLTCAIVL